MRTSSPKIMESLFNKKFKAIANNIDEAFVETGERGVGYLKRETPVDKGRLRNSMSYTVDNKVYKPLGNIDNVKASNEKESVIIGTNTVYAPSVEFLATNGSQGFMYRAYKKTKAVAKTIFKHAMQKGMRK